MKRNFYLNSFIWLLTISIVFSVSLEHDHNEKSSFPIVDDELNGTDNTSNTTENPMKIVNNLVSLNTTVKDSKQSFGWRINEQFLSTQKSKDENISSSSSDIFVNPNDKPNENLSSNRNDSSGDNTREGDGNSEEINDNANIQITGITDHPPRYRRFQSNNYNGHRRQNLQRYRIPQFYVAGKNSDCHIRRNNKGDENERFDEYDWYSVRRQNDYRKGQKNSQRKTNRPSKNSKRKQRPATQSKQPQHYNHSFLQRPIYKQQNRKPLPSSSHFDYPVVPVTEPQQQQHRYPVEIIPISWIQKLSEESDNNFENNHQSAAAVEYVLLVPENRLTSKRNKEKKIHKKKLTENKVSVENTTENALKNLQLQLHHHNDNSIPSFVQVPMTSAAVLLAGNVKQTLKNRMKDISLKKPLPAVVNNENPKGNVEEPINTTEGDQKNTKNRYIVIGDDDNDEESIERKAAIIGRRYFHSGNFYSKTSPARLAIYKKSPFGQSSISMEYLKERVL